jgi:hypothetical protein
MNGVKKDKHIIDNIYIKKISLNTYFLKMTKSNTRKLFKYLILSFFNLLLNNNLLNNMSQEY